MYSLHLWSRRRRWWCRVSSCFGEKGQARIVRVPLSFLFRISMMDENVIFPWNSSEYMATTLCNYMRHLDVTSHSLSIVHTHSIFLKKKVNISYDLNKMFSGHAKIRNQAWCTLTSAFLQSWISARISWIPLLNCPFRTPSKWYA